MTDAYRIFGSELSPYSIKVRSYFRYKQIPHVWIVRNSNNMAEFEKYAKLPLIPLVITPAGEGRQDSTPIIDYLESRFPEPAIHPADPTLAFLSALIEEYGDEWVNKPMFHYRWYYQADCRSAAERIARSTMPELAADAIEATCRAVAARMVPRLKFVGSSEATRDRIERSWQRLIAILDEHLSAREYLFGGRPALGDFGLYAQLYECSTDPTPAAIMRARAPHVLRWVERMLAPWAGGDFEPWTSLKPTLMPLLKEEIGPVFLPWTLANARALAGGQKTFSVELDGGSFSQEAQKYHAKSFAALRARYARVENKLALDLVLREAGCYEALQAS